MKDDPGFVKNRNFLRDMNNVFVGIVWQTALVARPIFIVIKKSVPALISFTVPGHIDLFKKFLI